MGVIFEDGSISLRQKNFHRQQTAQLKAFFNSHSTQDPISSSRYLNTEYAMDETKNVLLPQAFNCNWHNFHCCCVIQSAVLPHLCIINEIPPYTLSTHLYMQRAWPNTSPYGLVNAVCCSTISSNFEIINIFNVFFIWNVCHFQIKSYCL